MQWRAFGRIFATPLIPNTDQLRPKWRVFDFFPYKAERYKLVSSCLSNVPKKAGERIRTADAQFGNVRSPSHITCYSIELWDATDIG